MKLISLGAMVAILLVGQPAIAVNTNPPNPSPPMHWLQCTANEPATTGELVEPYEPWTYGNRLGMEGWLTPCHTPGNYDGWSFAEYSSDGTATGYWRTYATQFMAAVALKPTTVAVCIAVAADVRVHCLAMSLATDSNGRTYIQYGYEIPVGSPQVSIPVRILQCPETTSIPGNPLCPTCP